MKTGFGKKEKKISVRVVKLLDIVRSFGGGTLISPEGGRASIQYNEYPVSISGETADSAP
jgi:hypothetical protein